MKKFVVLLLAVLMLVSFASCSNSQPNMRSEIKKTIDNYESFVDEYCDFMKNYDPTDTKTLSKLSELLEKEEELTEDFEALLDKDLTKEELDYYEKVALRCEQKMMDVLSD